MSFLHNLSVIDVANIKARLLRGDFQHNIAADYGLNQGRISEINQGQRFAYVSPAKEVNNEASI